VKLKSSTFVSIVTGPDLKTTKAKIRARISMPNDSGQKKPPELTEGRDWLDGVDDGK